MQCASAIRNWLMLSRFLRTNDRFKPYLRVRFFLLPFRLVARNIISAVIHTLKYRAHSGRISSRLALCVRCAEFAIGACGGAQVTMAHVSAKIIHAHWERSACGAGYGSSAGANALCAVCIMRVSGLRCGLIPAPQSAKFVQRGLRIVGCANGL